jgi:hypothetical protein
LRSIATSATAGASYCAIVFAAGFLMGVVRYRVATALLHGAAWADVDL